MFNMLINLWSSMNNLKDALAVQVITALIVLLIVCYIFLNNRQRKREPPGPRGLPVVGYLPFLDPDLRYAFRDLANVYGPIFKLRLGLRNCIVVTSPSLAREVLKDKDSVFAYRNPSIAARLASFGASDIALSDYGPEWRKLKRIFVSDLLSNANIDGTYTVRKKQVQKMISSTYKKAGESVDVGEVIFSTFLNSIMTMVWGESLTEDGDDGGADGSDFRSVVTEFMLSLGAPNVSDFIPFLARFDLQGVRRRMKSAADKIEKLFDIAIDRHNAPDSNFQKDFLGYLLQLTKMDDPARSLTVPHIKAILMDAVIGGMDTTATTVEWAMAELLQHPNVMRKVQAELNEIVGLGTAVDEAHLPNLKYLNAVVKETLRLHPAVPLLVPHRASEHTTLGGYTVLKNSMVFVNVWAIHRDPEIWENPAAFQPERFLESSEKQDFLSLGNKHQYLPFGTGRRICPGLSLAEMMSMYILASLGHAFEWTLPNRAEEIDFSETFGIVPKKTKPLIAVPSTRLSDLELYSDV